MSSRASASESRRRFGDLRVEHLVGALQKLVQAPVHRQPPGARRDQADRDRRGGGAEDLDEAVAQPAAALRVLDPEHGAQDHLDVIACMLG